MGRLTANGNVLEHSRKLVRVLVELLTEVSRKLPTLELTKQSHLDAMDPPGRGAWPAPRSKLDTEFRNRNGRLLSCGVTLVPSTGNAQHLPS